ncbi:MAG: patatin-like phospholipase family protein [Rhodococcus sp. (in: high G+C Gram-positive bacteria)]|uniref:patatin-like phospholipase family protein n=1 Tax=Rhodococcus sp. TaxID=1831 RepID=UPI003BB1647F
MTGRTRVALALGGGGARGYAHIGTIQVLEERGFEIACVAGSSIGALVGGVYAAGKLDEFTSWALNLNQLDVVRLLDLSVSAPGAIHAEKILNRVRDILGDIRIEDLPMPYTAVATDLAAGRSVWFQQGPVDAAIRASIAIPGVITPYVLNGRVLADGAILDPLPVAPTLSSGAGLTVGVILGAEDREGEVFTPENASADVRPVDEWMGRFRRSAAQLLERDLVRTLVGRLGSTPAESDESEDISEASDDATATDGTALLVPKFSRFAVMNRSLDVMQAALARYQLAVHPPDVLVRVPRNACRSLEFHRAGEMIKLGRELTESALDAAGVTAGAGSLPAEDEDGGA